MMRQLIFVAAILFPMMAFVQGNPEKVEFKVHGNCGGCKATIEKAAMTDGVTKAEWSVETKMLSLTYDPETVSLENVYQRIADTGYAFDRIEAKGSDCQQKPTNCGPASGEKKEKTVQSARAGGC